jgi:multimeric flavodoxin WrbA
MVAVIRWQMTGDILDAADAQGSGDVTIIGLSGSPIANGNTDRMVRTLLEQSGRDHTFVNLSTLRYEPCRACAHLCAKTNLCPVDDDLEPFFEPIMHAEALVLGTPIHGGHVTGWMYSFTTRLSCFSHVRHPLRDKPVLLVVTGLTQKGETRSVQRFRENVVEQSRGARVIGHIYYASRIPPCYKCGMGHVCQVGGLWGMLGRSEERLRAFRLRPEMFRRWEDCPETTGQVEYYAKVLSEV